MACHKCVVLTILHIYVFIDCFTPIAQRYYTITKMDAIRLLYSKYCAFYGLDPLALFINLRLDINNILSCPPIQILDTNCSRLRSEMSRADISTSRVVSYSFLSVCQFVTRAGHKQIVTSILFKHKGDKYNHNFKLNGYSLELHGNES